MKSNRPSVCRKRAKRAKRDIIQLARIPSKYKENAGSVKDTEEERQRDRQRQRESERISRRITARANLSELKRSD
jgi:hypothetical protein